jgi:hypothetical protein
VSRSHNKFDTAVDAACDSDPRLGPEFVRTVNDGPSPVLLVGVVHDHPASMARVRTLVDRVEPDLIAIELPDILVPVVEDASSELGGEMAAAVSVDATTPAVGIDVPGRGTGRSLLAELRTRDVSPGTLRETVRSLGTITARAVAGRLARLDLPVLPSLNSLEYGHQYGLDGDASPRQQAAHELSHLQRSRSLLETFEPPPATEFLDAIRERHMANRIANLRKKGSVVAVVGHGHLNAIGTALETDGP